MGKGIISQVSGPVARAKNVTGIAMSEEVRIGEQGLVGEVIEVHGDEIVIQIYEETTGLQPGEKVVGKGAPLSVELGPGLMGETFDGIQRPLKKIRKKEGIFITPGQEIEPLSREKEWKAEIKVSQGDQVGPNHIIAEVQETSLLKHRIIVPPGIKGKVKKINKKDSYNIDDTICVVETENGAEELKLYQKWPVRQKRPFLERMLPEKILFTGQRVIDFLFPIAKGGVAAIPGGFGTGKTVTQHALAKWADADIIIYIGCGERGNEMAQVLEEFPELQDPHSGKSLMERTILIANTSNMPVTARESSIYTGITIAEYFRDMGYDVAMMAD
ncbi:MAG: V-type ATP synthase subunit A, partial [Candidatus Marinimicrobia bacterium]|nr:V-type ATP synthase subunit A [Candidatus Neomarinimicrobiota bacterium]